MTETVLRLQGVMKRVQYLSDQVLRSRQSIHLNMDVIKDIIEQVERLPIDLGTRVPNTGAKMQAILREHRYLLRNASGVAERIANLSENVSRSQVSLFC